MELELHIITLKLFFRGRKMRLHKIGWLCIVLTLIASLIHAGPVNAAASKYTGGLLDGIPLLTGSAIGQPSGSPVTQLTDNNAGTRFDVNAGKPVWHSFSAPGKSLQ